MNITQEQAPQSGPMKRFSPLLFSCRMWGQTETDMIGSMKGRQSSSQNTIIVEVIVKEASKHVCKCLHFRSGHPIYRDFNQWMTAFPR